MYQKNQHYLFKNIVKTVWHVEEMRNLLLQYGANENDDDKARWRSRQETDLYETIRLNNEREIDKDYDPLSGSVEY